MPLVCSSPFHNLFLTSTWGFRSHLLLLPHLQLVVMDGACFRQHSPKTNPKSAVSEQLCLWPHIPSSCESCPELKWRFAPPGNLWVTSLHETIIQRLQKCPKLWWLEWGGTSSDNIPCTYSTYACARAHTHKHIHTPGWFAHSNLSVVVSFKPVH